MYQKHIHEIIFYAGCTMILISILIRWFDELHFIQIFAKLEVIKLATPCVYVNDDEVNFKHILILYSKSKNLEKTYTIAGAEKRGLVKVETGTYKLGGHKYSKSIAFLNNCVSIYLTTRIFG